MDFTVNNSIAALIESWLASPEMARGSLHATLQFGEELEQACVGTPLNGKAIREKLIPFRHGMKPDDEHALKRLAELLKADATFTLANMFLAGSGYRAICQAAMSIPGCTLSLQQRGEFFAEELGV